MVVGKSGMVNGRREGSLDILDLSRGYRCGHDQDKHRVFFILFARPSNTSISLLLPSIVQPLFYDIFKGLFGNDEKICFGVSAVSFPRF